MLEADKKVGDESGGQQVRLATASPAIQCWPSMMRSTKESPVYLVNDAVLTSGLDGENSIVEEPFWRSFDAHELRQEVRQEVRQELSEDS